MAAVGADDGGDHRSPRRFGDVEAGGGGGAIRTPARPPARADEAASQEAADGVEQVGLWKYCFHRRLPELPDRHAGRPVSLHFRNGLQRQSIVIVKSICTNHPTNNSAQVRD